MLFFQQYANIILLCCSSSYVNIGNQSEESWYQDKLIAREVKAPEWWARQTTEDKPTGRVQMCPVLPSVTNFDLAAMQLWSHGNKLQLSKPSWEKMPKSSLCPCKHTIYWGAKHMRGIQGNICKQRDQQLLSSDPSWPPLRLSNSKESYAGNNTVDSSAFNGFPHAYQGNMWRACPEKIQKVISSAGNHIFLRPDVAM